MTKNYKFQEKEPYDIKSYHITLRTINLIDYLADKYTKEAGFKISKGKLLEIALHHIKNKSLKDLL